LLELDWDYDILAVGSGMGVNPSTRAIFHPQSSILVLMLMLLLLRHIAYTPH